MFNFLKGLFGIKTHKPAEGDTILEMNLTGDANLAGDTPGGDERPVIETVLSLHPKWLDSISSLHKNLLNEDLSQLPPIKEGDITINGIHVVKMSGKYEVGLFIRNGLNRPVRLDKIPLVITNSENEVLAREVFDLQELGEIPPCSCRPWEIFFNTESVFVETIPYDNWKIAFDLQPRQSEPVRVTFENLPEQLTDAQRVSLHQYLEKLPPLKLGELNVMSFEAQLQEGNNLAATVIIRNGGQRSVKLERLPLALKDARQRDVAFGVFNLKNLVIQPYSARLWTFVFPTETLLAEDIDLSYWSVYLKVEQNNQGQLPAE